jgi:hypothetical protein
MGYQPKVYRKQGGDEMIVANTGNVEVESGGTVKVKSGGKLELQTGSTFGDSLVGAAGNRAEYIEKIALTSPTTSAAGGVLQWVAPTGANVMITGFYLQLSVASTQAGCVLDIGTTSANATTKSDNLIDGMAATGTAALTARTNLDSTHRGTNGRGVQRLTAGKWITGTSTGTASTALAGHAYVRYMVL